jgi:hypothetical protein
LYTEGANVIAQGLYKKIGFIKIEESLKGGTKELHFEYDLSNRKIS